MLRWLETDQDNLRTETALGCRAYHEHSLRFLVRDFLQLGSRLFPTRGWTHAATFPTPDKSSPVQWRLIMRPSTYSCTTVVSNPNIFEQNIISTPVSPALGGNIHTNFGRSALDTANFRQDSCTILTEETVGAQNPNLAPKFPPNVGFWPHILHFLHKNFRTRRKFSSNFPTAQNLYGRGTNGCTSCSTTSWKVKTNQRNGVGTLSAMPHCFHVLFSQ